MGSFGVVSTDSLDGVWMNVSAGKKSGHDELYIGADLCSLLCYSGACVYDNVRGCATESTLRTSPVLGHQNSYPSRNFPLESMKTGVVAVAIFWGSSSGLWWVAGVTGL